MPWGLIRENQRPQHAPDALYLLHVAEAQLLLAARGPRQATEAHDVAFAQVPQGNGQLGIHQLSP
jgi:hypothetical protein